MLVQARNLRSQGVDLAHGLNGVQVEAAALCVQVVRLSVEVGCEVAGSGQDCLPQRKIGGIDGKLLKAVKKFTDGIADAGIGAGESDLNLLKSAHGSVQPALILGFLADAKLENRVAQAFESLQNHPSADAQAANHDWVAWGQVRTSPGESGRVGVGHIVGGIPDFLLADQQCAQGDGE